jgi:hypothetical protein
MRAKLESEEMAKLEILNIPEKRFSLAYDGDCFYCREQATEYAEHGIIPRKAIGSNHLAVQGRKWSNEAGYLRE